jgi:hypothetical protein
MVAETARGAEVRGGAFYVSRHLRFGWWSLLVFLSLGIALDAMHGFKLGWYLDTVNETRRLMFTLAHAHGTLLGLVHLGFAASVRALPGWTAASRARASNLFLAGGVLLPLGFLLGGIVVYDGDPGLGVLLTPIGAGCLLAAVLLTAQGVQSAASQSSRND